MRQGFRLSNVPPDLTRRQLIHLGVMGFSGWLLAPMQSAKAALTDDMELVCSIPEMDQRDGPLLIFRDFEVDPDVEVERHLRRQLRQRKDLHARVKNKIRFEKEVMLSIEALEVRLMFVPQLRKDHSAAYQRFCRDITDFFFETVRENSFYAAITSPRKSYPERSQNGISAFLVHRLAKEYRAICRFTAESGRSVAFKASGAIFSNHLGAVDLEIQVVADGQFGLNRKAFTIWQNDTDNLHTLMSVPVEETLHFYLGRATDRQIASCMDNNPPKTLREAWRLAEEWMAVEEAAVGGLVNRVLRDFCRRYHLAPSTFVPGSISSTSQALPQYRYRDPGARMVDRLGLHQSMDLYMQSPATFRTQLLLHQGA